LGSAQPPSAELTRAAAMPADDKAEVADPVRSPAAAPPPAPVALPATPPSTAPATAQEAGPEKAGAAAKPANSGNDGQRAQALLEGKPSEDKAQPTEGGRFIVQVGAYADAAKAREVRLKMERGGIKTYTHVANTKDGQLTRVRVGPFASRSEAEQAAAKVKKLDLPASVLAL